jgi:hypothetical protein
MNQTYGRMRIQDNEDQLSPNCMPCTNAWEFLDQFLKAEQQNLIVW